jgi:hypothetical protein
MTKAFREKLLDALDEYSVLLESGIECHTIPGTSDAVPVEQPILDELRVKWRKVEDLKIALERHQEAVAS